jgi:hypothetical protein
MSDIGAVLLFAGLTLGVFGFAHFFGMVMEKGS